MIKRCEMCGHPFHAQRSTAKYCSTRCRVQAHRGYAPICPDAPPVVSPKTDSALDDTALLITNAKQLSSAFAEQAKVAPLQLRAGCERVAVAIFAAIESEGWL